MDEPLKGGQQFFSNYLKAFRETVDKLTEISFKIDAMIPKYSVGSNNIKHEKTYNPFRWYQTYIGTGDISNSFIDSFQAQINGHIKILSKIRLQTAGRNGYLQFQINGITVSNTEYVNDVNWLEVVDDLPVKEGDTVSIYARAVTGGSALALEYLKIGYDLIDKPNITL